MVFKGIRSFLENQSLAFLNECINEDKSNDELFRGKEYEVKSFLTRYSPDRGYSIARFIVLEKCADRTHRNPRIFDAPFFFLHRNYNN